MAGKPQDDGLYAAVGAGEDGRPEILCYLAGDCHLPAICRAPDPDRATAVLSAKMRGRHGEWAVVRYPRDSVEHFAGAEGYEVVALCPRSLEDRKLAAVLAAFLEKVSRRIKVPG